MSDSEISLGGPPLELFHSDLHLSGELESSDDRHKNSAIDGCNNCHNADKMYERMQDAIDCVCNGASGPTGSLCQAVQASNLLNTVPFTSMVELITGPYSICQSVIPPEHRQAAYDSFVSITGYTPPNLTQVVTTISNNQKSLANYTALYVFLILLMLAIIILAILVLVSVLTWPMGIIIAVLIFLSLYTISLAYTLGAQRMIDDQSSQILETVTNEQSNFQNTVAYWPQGLFGIASTLTATGATGATGIWPCNTGAKEVADGKVEEFHLSSELPLSALSIEDISSLTDKKPNKLKKLKHDSLIKKPGKLTRTSMKLGSRSKSRLRGSSRVNRLK